MDRQIFRIAFPSVLSNVTVPLLALVDTAIVGHLGAPAYIGAIAVGGLLFNMIYWLFGFLRMGTGGLTAQAFGARHADEAQGVLLRSLLVAGVLSLLILLLQRPLLAVAFRFIAATPEVESLSRVYFRILVWGAPAVLAQYSFMGWFLGMQNARLPLMISILQNVVNIAVSLVLVVCCGMKVEGVALGTLAAQYAAVLAAAGSCYTLFFRRSGLVATRAAVFGRGAFVRFFRVNSDIFFRTLCLISVTVCFTSVGSARGEMALAANTLLMQFFILFSYVMDGLAYAGEALGGRFFGAADLSGFRLLTRRLFLWGAGAVLLFTLAYVSGGRHLLSLLTDDASVLSAAAAYLPFAALIPVVSFSAFLFDGLFIGVTATRQMLLTMVVAAVLFFLLLRVLPADNAALWTAFLAYLAARSLFQALLFPKVKARFGENVK